jgi:hypothetical protein
MSAEYAASLSPLLIASSARTTATLAGPSAKSSKPKKIAESLRHIDNESWIFVMGRIMLRAQAIIIILANESWRK